MKTIPLDLPVNGGGGKNGDGGPGSGGNGLGDGGSSDANRLHCSGGAQAATISVTQEVPSIMFALDRSHSMGTKLGTSATSPNKLTAVTNAIAAIVTNPNYTPFVQFGYVEFPGVNSNGNCSSSSPQIGCCAGGLVPLGRRDGNYGQLLDQLSKCNQPNTLSCGPDDTLTPTGQALQKIASQLSTTGGSLYALVLTDGPPTCTIDSSSDATACEQTVKQIMSMSLPSAGPAISTFIMGIGDISDDHDCLSTMATAGGHARGNQSPFYPIATTEVQVGSEMADIVTSTICRLDVGAGQNFDPTRLEVDLNGTQIPPDSAGNQGGGWTFDATTKTIVIDGDQCDNFVNTGPSHRVAVKACPDSHSTFPSSSPH